MSVSHWRILKCTKCSGTKPNIVIVRWGYDKDWTLRIEGICRHCYQKFNITHTRDEQLADIREAYVEWIAHQSDPMSVDMLIWENEFLEGRQLEEGDEDEG